MVSLDRKSREKAAFRQLILETGQDILTQQGLEGLTMRSLAQAIEYWQSKIYEYFSSKDKLCEAMCEEMCQKMLGIAEQVQKNTLPENYLAELITTVMSFHADYPHSDELLTLVCFNPERFHIPQSFKELEQYYVAALKNLQSPYISNEHELQLALDAIRCVKIGVATLLASETSTTGKHRIQNMTKNLIQVLIRGWKT